MGGAIGGILQGGGTWELSRCRFLGAYGAASGLGSFDGPTLTVHDCLIAMSIGPGCRSGAKINLRNNLIHLSSVFAPSLGVLNLMGGGQSVLLHSNTVLCDNGQVMTGDNRDGKPVTVEATGNLFRALNLVTLTADPAARLRWNGQENLYALTQDFVYCEKARVTGLAAWDKLWGKPEPGSREVKDVWFAWDAATRDDPEKALPALRRLTETERRRHELAELGPRWDLVGPGEAYVRALAAAGDPRAKEPLRPAAPEDGPVVVLRGGKLLRGYDTLAEAFAAAADGDVIELRTDGPLAGAELGGDRELTLTVRAAPGYRPVIAGDLNFRGPVRYSLEGLHLRKALVTIWSSGGRLVRLANCSFDPCEAVHALPVRPAAGADRPPEIVNCWLPWPIAFFPTSALNFRVRDSVIGLCWFEQDTKAGQLELELERCLVWNPGQGRFSPNGVPLLALQPTPPTKVRVSAHASLFESGLLGWGKWIDPKGTVRWTGAGNVYRTGNDHLLQGLRTHGSAEEGSATDDPLERDPAQWRLLPGQPKRPDGSDYGADVSRVLAPADAGKTAEPGAHTEPAPADKDKPFVVVHPGGGREEFKHFAAAAVILQAGDTVEVHGNGPFTFPHIELKAKGLTLRAGLGYRPRFVPAVEALAQPHWVGWLSLGPGGSLRAEGCDWSGFPGLLFRGDDKAEGLDLRGCRILGAEHAVFFHGARLRIADSLLSADNPIDLGSATELELTDNILMAVGGPMINLGQARGDRRARLVHNTAFTGQSFLVVAPDQGGRMHVEAEGNLIHTGNVIAFGVGKADDARQCLDWHGRDNLFRIEYGWAALNGQQAPLAKDLAEWNKFCGREEKGAVVAATIHFGWDEAARVEPDIALRLIREATAADCRKAGGIGPNWDQVGPGAAYVRALAADAGKPLPKERLRPEAPVGRPFVLIRAGQEVRGYPTLQAAVDATADGDVVEIRTDGPFTGCKVEGKKDLTFRAAPGYLPGLEGGLDYHQSTLTAIEGIHFRKGQLTHANFPGSIARVANCSFDARLPAPRAPRCELVRCFIPTWIDTDWLQTGNELVLRDTVLGGIMNEGSSQDGTARLNAERCLFWNPQLPNLPGRPAKCKTLFTVRQTLFDSGSRVGLDGALGIDQERWAGGWDGSHNVYRQVRPDVVASFRKRYGSSEEGSLDADPYLYDPRAWRLPPGSPGYRAGPDGKDLGADVTRVAALHSASPGRQPIQPAGYPPDPIVEGVSFFSDRSAPVRAYFLVRWVPGCPTKPSATYFFGGFVPWLSSR
jgi:hypothetical protein